MVGSKSLMVALISGGIAAGTLQVVHAAGSNAATAGPTVQKLDDDQYPHMRKALEDLKHARESLENAEPRFKGHREKAIEHVDKAIEQCQIALKEG
jgi:hypothetical protein